MHTFAKITTARIEQTILTVQFQVAKTSSYTVDLPQIGYLTCEENLHYWIAGLYFVYYTGLLQICVVVPMMLLATDKIQHIVHACKLHVSVEFK